VRDLRHLLRSSIVKSLLKTIAPAMRVNQIHQFLDDRFHGFGWR